MKRLCATVVVLAAVAFTAAAPAGAQNPVVVDIFPCVNVSGGNTTVPADTPFVLRWGFFDFRRGFVQSFLQAELLEVSIDGVPLADPTSYHQPIAPFVHPVYGDVLASFWVYPGPAGMTLATGDSLTIVWRLGVAHKLVASADPGQFGPSLGFYGPGWLTPVLSCTVTAA